MSRTTLDVRVVAIVLVMWGLMCFLAGRQQSALVNNKPDLQIPQQRNSDNKSLVWNVEPLEHTGHVEFLPSKVTDAFNPIHNYFKLLLREEKADFPELPLLHSWAHFFEPYHNHFHRFRGKKVVFMEIGVQSGGKIPLLRDYLGPGLTYVGVDINPSTKKFESADWVHIEIGDSENREFLATLKRKYPHVDIFLDDGGHTMNQQIIAMEEMLPHVQPEGVYICEDLSTSWSPKFGGISNADVGNHEFLNKTAFGLMHKTMDWLNNGWIQGSVMEDKQLPDEYYPEKWWRAIPDQVKHIHVYNQLVVYEKGLTFAAKDFQTVGTKIPYSDSGVHDPVDWDLIMKKLQKYTNSEWKW